MIGNDLRFAIVVSTRGSVMNEVLKDGYFRSRVQLVVTDHVGEAYEKARTHSVPARNLEATGSDEFCERLLPLLTDNHIDYVFSFYTEFYTAEFRSVFQDRILNFHPSLLPAFKGMDGFADTVAYGARFAGNTVEFIADVMDEGKIIMQTACPVDPARPVRQTRHLVFVQQCRALLQVARWLQEGRIETVGHRVVVAGATFDDGMFSPALDCVEAASWTPPDPDGVLV